MASDPLPYDPEAILQSRLGALTVRVLEDLEWQMTHAPPAARRELLKSVIPALFKGQSERSVDEELDEMRNELAELHESVRKSLFSTPATAVEASPPTDLPSLPQ